MLAITDFALAGGGAVPIKPQRFESGNGVGIGATGGKSGGEHDQRKQNKAVHDFDFSRQR
jgi:hypothetical protein